MNVVKWLVRNCDEVEIYGVSEGSNYFYGKYLGRNIRLSSNNCIDIGDGDFDRWANSVACTFTIKSVNTFATQLRTAMYYALSETRNCTYTDLDLVGTTKETSERESVDVVRRYHSLLTPKAKEPR
jgi:hypothetical protein